MEEIKKEPVTALLILLNILIFLIVEFTGGSENGQHMLECGACYAPLILEQGEWYRVFFSMFLHFGAPHLINNILVLFVLGQRLEPAVGKLKFLLIYIAGGLGGNLISLFWDMHTGDYSVSAGEESQILLYARCLSWQHFLFILDSQVKVWIMRLMQAAWYAVF